MDVSVIILLFKCSVIYEGVMLQVCDVDADVCPDGGASRRTVGRLAPRKIDEGVGRLGLGGRRWEDHHYSKHQMIVHGAF